MILLLFFEIRTVSRDSISPAVGNDVLVDRRGIASSDVFLCRVQVKEDSLAQVGDANTVVRSLDRSCSRFLDALLSVGDGIF